MAKIKVIKHRLNTYRNCYGKVMKREYDYYIAVRRFGFLWTPLAFSFPLDTTTVNAMLSRKEVRISYTSRQHATVFYSEEDANIIKNDILQHPDKYVKVEWYRN